MGDIRFQGATQISPFQGSRVSLFYPNLALLAGRSSLWSEPVPGYFLLGFR